jgi:hypothetical protein
MWPAFALLRSGLAYRLALHKVASGPPYPAGTLAVVLVFKAVSGLYCHSLPAVEVSVQTPFSPAAAVVEADY